MRDCLAFCGARVVTSVMLPCPLSVRRAPSRSSLLAVAAAAAALVFAAAGTSAQAPAAESAAFDSLTAGLERVEGLLAYYHDPATDRLLLEVPADVGDLIYVNSLAAGVGSNDLGLDRGQLGDTRLVRFRKTGGKLLLEQPNLDYRALSDNPDERASVAEAFASSVLAGFPILATRAGGGPAARER